MEQAVDVRDQRAYWDKLVHAGIDAAVIDPHDRRGYKNRYIIEMRTAAFLREMEQRGIGPNVLDFGCGTGNLTRSLGGAGYRAIGVDISHQLLVSGSNVAGSGTWDLVEYDGSRLPFQDGQFDAVTTYVVLNHIIDSAQLLNALREINRVLKPGGTLLAIEQILRRSRLSADRAQLRRRRSEFMALFRDAGFAVERAAIIRRGHFPLIYVIRYGLLPHCLWALSATIEKTLGNWFSNPVVDYADVLFVSRKPD